jgi:hypothetical protein
MVLGTGSPEAELARAPAARPPVSTPAGNGRLFFCDVGVVVRQPHLIALVSGMPMSRSPARASRPRWKTIGRPA